MCVYSNSRNDVPRVAQRYGTNAAHTRRRASVLVMFVVCLRAHVQFCRFDKADATADVQWHCNHRPPLWYHYFPAQSSLGADILVYWIGKIVRTCAPGGSRTLDFLRARRAPYPQGQALRFNLRVYGKFHALSTRDENRWICNQCRSWWAASFIVHCLPSSLSVFHMI